MRRQLAAELGVDPGRELVAAHHELLGQGGGLAPAVRYELLKAPPAQLPADLPGFTGRRAELAALERPGGPVTVVLDGMPGVGKSTLAVHWARRVADRFPDGQLFLDLRGFDAAGPPTGRTEALGILLGGLGLPPDRIPGDVDTRLGLYRSTLADRRIVVLLDNARDAEQVAALLPAAPGCAAIVTSRNRLTGLAVLGALLLNVDLPSFGDARESLVERVGAARAAAEPEAVDAIIACCGRLALALAVAGARNPRFPLGAVAAELSAAAGPLDALGDDDARSSVRGVFSWSYRLLRPPAARMLRLLSLHQASDISLAAAASLAGVPARRARDLLGELPQGRLLTERLPGRFDCHDLIHAYAAERCTEEDPPRDRDAATARLVAHYRHTARLAQLWLDPAAADPAEGSSPPDGVTVEEIDDNETAVRILVRISTAVAAHVRRRHS